MASQEAKLEICHVEAWIARTTAPRHPLTLSHYWGKHFVRIDNMHVKDLRGVIAIAAGGLLQQLVSNYAALGATHQERLDALNKDMRTFQTAAETRAEHIMPYLRLTDLKTDGWHMLSGKLVKGANTRSLVPWLKSAAHKFLSPHGAVANALRRVFDCLCEIDRIQYNASVFFTLDEKRCFAQQFDILGNNWMYLRSMFRLAKVDAFQITPKVHIFFHLPMQSDLINPRMTQVYQEESLIGHVARVWRASAKGPYRATVQQSALMRLFAGLECRMTADL